jgi:hypothetical protein
MRFAARVFLLSLAVMVLAAGCKQPRKVVLTKDQKERIKANLLAAAPSPKLPLNTDFGDSIRLLGVDVEPATATAGEKLEITYYWQCLKAVPGDWKVFVHMEKPRAKRQILDHHAVGELYPIGQWQVGEIVKDVQSLTVDADFPPGGAELWVGIFNEEAWVARNANERLPVTAKGTARTDNENRVLAATLTIAKGTKATAAAAPVPVPPVAASIRKAATPPVIDGAINPDEWKGATPLALTYRPDGRKLEGTNQTEGYILWDATNLYVTFTTRDPEIQNQFTERDSTLWQQDVLEVYLDPYGDEKDYLELQVAPSGAVFDAFFTEHRKPEWPEASKNFNIELKAGVKLDGTLNDGEGDKAWSVELAIPLKSIPNLKEGSPKAGETWKANFYRLDHNPKAGTPSQAVWAPAGGDFHNLQRAGTLTFADEAPAP